MNQVKEPVCSAQPAAAVEHNLFWTRLPRASAISGACMAKSARTTAPKPQPLLWQRASHDDDEHGDKDDDDDDDDDDEDEDEDDDDDDDDDDDGDDDDDDDNDHDDDDDYGDDDDDSRMIGTCRKMI